MEIKKCKNCQQTFEITNQDFAFYKKMDVPPPTLCPDCREQRRLSFRNEHHLYRRTCDFCKKEIIAIYKPNTKFPVYCGTCFWSKKWNPLSYSHDFDFKKTFFEQFHKLLLKIPRLAIINRNSTNSEYTNICEHNKNCYLLIESSDNEDCLYSYWIQKSKDCVDCSFVDNSTLCFECDNCENCYNLDYSQNCKDCHDSKLLKNCTGCSNCIACTNLVQKSYHILNKKCSKEEFEETSKNLKESSPNSHDQNDKYLEKFQSRFQDLDLYSSQKFAQIMKSENCTGDYIVNSKNCSNCFHAQDAEECRYAYHVWRNSKYVMDSDTVGMNSELAYECINTAINSYNNRFCNRCWTVSDSYYSNECDNSSNLFGCIGLNRYKYCILNKQYSKEEYEKLLPKIIDHMEQTKEYGEFFPMELSPFKYEETIANDYYPTMQRQISFPYYS